MTISKNLIYRQNGKLAASPYPERADSKEYAIDRKLLGMTAGFWLLAQKFDRSPRRFLALVESMSERFGRYSAAELHTQRLNLQRQLHRQGLAFELTAACFALVRETSSRVLGQKHYPVQVLGALALIKGRIAEMATGEGKTLTATLAAATAALSGMPVHIVTVNDYLAKRDAEEMGPLYRALGLSVGYIQNNQSPEEKRTAYACDITYCTNKELGFDYLRDRLKLADWPSANRLHLRQLLNSGEQTAALLLRGLFFAIVDEADSVLIDEARTPLIISASGQDLLDADTLSKVIAFAGQLQLGEDYELFPKQRFAQLKMTGLLKARAYPENNKLPLLTPVWTELVAQALAAMYLYHRDQHYLVKENSVQIIDEYTGRLMPDRTWEYGLHQLIEAKEHCEISAQRTTLARITYQRFFRRYLLLAGMTGTGKEVASELWAVYRLKTVFIPCNRPLQRRYYPVRLLPSQALKWQAVVAAARHETLARGRPVLIGTCSVDASEQLSALLRQAGLQHQMLNARQDADEAHLIANAGQAGCLTVATNMAGRGTDIKLGLGVAERGGLHIILTEFSESGRIDRQLYGRAGRQGDPGSAQAIVALDDALFRNHLPAWLRKTFHFANGWNRLAVVWRIIAQFRAESLHADIREATLKSDQNIDRLLAFTGKELL